MLEPQIEGKLTNMQALHSWKGLLQDLITNIYNFEIEVTDQNVR